jgi:hypothetical protein
MRDLRNRHLMYLKAALLFLSGVIASIILILENPTARFVALLAIAIWAFCRAYYFAFYVIQHYIDPQHRFAGLIDFARYVAKGRKA